ncbi:MAG: transglutaminase family protein [Burkholderiaceae bacterium]
MDRPQPLPTQTRRIRVNHETRYLYQPAVTTSWHQAHLEPGNTPCQRVVSVHRQVYPRPTFALQTTDAFGNQQWFFNQETAHAELTVCVTSILETWSIAGDATGGLLLAEKPAVPRPESVGGAAGASLGESLGASLGASPWESMAQAIAYAPQKPAPRESLYAYPSTYVPRDPEFIAFSAEVFTAGRPLVEVCKALTALLHQELQYNPQTTTVQTAARTALAQRSGVCQDFAHIMLACLRSRGLAARYVSGYLITEPAEGQPRLIGADASHAWVAVYLGDGQWLDCDPTNNRTGLASPGPDYIRLAVGRDFADVSPLRGVIHGGAHHRLEVGVTVAPEGDTLTDSHDHALSTRL